MAIVGNFFMRLAWAFNISPGQPYVAQNVILLFGCLEIFRRFVWLTFRVENMDLNAKAKKAARSSSRCHLDERHDTEHLVWKLTPTQAPQGVILIN